MTHLPPDAGTVLLPLARDAVRAGLRLPTPARDLPGWTDEPAATFVSLHAHGRLRGCIGSLVPHRALADDVRANAVAAAFSDPRFPPVEPDELAGLVVEVSVLGAPEPLPAADTLAAAAASLRPGVDGVVLRSGGRRATYLPQVWGQVADPEAFLRSLRAKAGLDPDAWDAGTRLDRYGVTSWSEDTQAPAG